MLFVASALVFIVLGILLDRSYQLSTPEPEFAQGKIVDFQRLHSKQVYPIFEFSDSEGKLHRVVSSAQQSLPRFVAGDLVPVAYSRANPENARINNFWFNNRWKVGALMVSLSFVVAAFTRTK
jgi:Protein of unknown function (DUF3592)